MALEQLRGAAERFLSSNVFQRNGKLNLIQVQRTQTGFRLGPKTVTIKIILSEYVHAVVVRKISEKRSLIMEI